MPFSFSLIFFCNKSSSVWSIVILSTLILRLKDFKEFADVIEVVKSKGVAVAVASRDDVEAANKECSDFFQVKKAF